MKTYTVTRRLSDDDDSQTIERRTVRSYDDPDQAATEILEQLGYEITPCCYSEDEPCRECAAELSADAVDRLIDIARDEAALGGKP